MDKKESQNFKNIMYNPISFWVSIFTLLGIIIGVFIYLTSPGQNNNTALKLQDQRITYQQGVIDDLTKTQQNDTQEIKAELVGLRKEVQTQNIAIEKLIVTIEERLPR